eukprot:COSAG06_NODE_7829_length_2361_cov_3.967728_2_plen_87_part_00
MPLFTVAQSFAQDVRGEGAGALSRLPFVDRVFERQPGLAVGESKADVFIRCTLVPEQVQARFRSDSISVVLRSHPGLRRYRSSEGK